PRSISFSIPRQGPGGSCGMEKRQETGIPLANTGCISALRTQVPSPKCRIIYARLYSDYVADETATLLKARGAGQLIASFSRLLDSSEVLSFLFIHDERFRKAQEFFLKHHDHAYSFTDCTSFLLMKELGSR